MKIGILTYHSVYNFGANLQVYSTVRYLKNNGFEPIVINWVPEGTEVRSDLNVPDLQAEAHEVFIKNNLPCSKICKTDEEIVEVIQNENIKGIIIGSDAVFRQKPFLSRIHLKRKGLTLEPKPTKDWLFPNPFWGSFISLMNEKIPVVVMSVSSQNTLYKYIRGKLKRRMCSSLQQFQYITVRDDWTRKMVSYLTNGNIIPSITPDPVFAYNQNIKDQVSEKEIKEKFNLHDNYILISFRSRNVASKEWMKTFQSISEKNNLQCVALSMPGGIKFEHPFSKIIEPPLSPKEWYGLIKFSSGYIGENMHPVVVALHNAVPFFSFDSYGIVMYKFFVNEKSSKIYDILYGAGFLKNRISILGKRYKCPTAGEILHQIIDFDSEKCNKFSIRQQEEYNIMMKNITNLLIS